MSSGHTDILGDVILCCWIGNVLGLGITSVVLRVSMRAFAGIVTRWCLLSGIQCLQYKGDPSEFGSSHILWNISIITSMHEIQATAHIQGTWQIFHLQFIWVKCKPPTQEIQGVICLPKPADQTSTLKIQIGGCSLFLCGWNLYFYSFGCLVFPFT